MKILEYITAIFAVCIVLCFGFLLKIIFIDADERYNQKPKLLKNLSTSSEAQRFSIVHTSSFEDWFARNKKLNIYIITDSYTGKECIGVSGVGISELGSHQAGKANITDER